MAEDKKEIMTYLTSIQCTSPSLTNNAHHCPLSPTLSPLSKTLQIVLVMSKYGHI